MMDGTMRLAAALTALLALAGCNAGGPRSSATAPLPATRETGPGQPRSPVMRTGIRLPSGPGCAGEAARFRAVMDNDLATGHVGGVVHARVGVEIGQAESACAAGREAEASGLIRAAKARHGYR